MSDNSILKTCILISANPYDYEKEGKRKTGIGIQYVMNENLQPFCEADGTGKKGRNVSRGYTVLSGALPYDSINNLEEVPARYDIYFDVIVSNVGGRTTNSLVPRLVSYNSPYEMA